MWEVLSYGKSSWMALFCYRMRTCVYNNRDFSGCCTEQKFIVILYHRPWWLHGGRSCIIILQLVIGTPHTDSIFYIPMGIYEEKTERLCHPVCCGRCRSTILHQLSQHPNFLFAYNIVSGANTVCLSITMPSLISIQVKIVVNWILARYAASLAKVLNTYFNQLYFVTPTWMHFFLGSKLKVYCGNS